MCIRTGVHIKITPKMRYEKGPILIKQYESVGHSNLEIWIWLIKIHLAYGPDGGWLNILFNPE